MTYLESQYFIKMRKLYNNIFIVYLYEKGNNHYKAKFTLPLSGCAYCIGMKKYGITPKAGDHACHDKTYAVYDLKESDRHGKKKSPTRRIFHSFDSQYKKLYPTK